MEDQEATDQQVQEENQAIALREKQVLLANLVMMV